MVGGVARAIRMPRGTGRAASQGACQGGLEQTKGWCGARTRSAARAKLRRGCARARHCHEVGQVQGPSALIRLRHHRHGL